LHAWASRTIEAGEELFLTYDNCSDCDAVPESWGTTEILRDFGFVELHPRQFNLGGEEQQILVAVDEHEHDGETIAHIDWLGNGESPSHEQIKSMNEECQQLPLLQHNGVLEERCHLVPEKEWNTIFQHHQAFTAAFPAAVHVAMDDLEDANEDDHIDAVDDAFESIDNCEKDNIDERLCLQTLCFCKAASCKRTGSHSTRPPKPMPVMNGDCYQQNCCFCMCGHRR
jgi:hypothetical protein